MKTNRLTIARKLWLAIGAIGLAMIGLLAATGARTAVLQKEARVQQDRQEHLLNQLKRWSALTEINVQRVVASIVATDESVAGHFKPEVAATSKEISAIQKDIEAIATADDEKQHLASIAAARKAYLDARKVALAKRAEGDQAGSLQALQSTVLPAVQAYTKTQQDFVAAEQARADALREEIGAQRMRTVAASAAFAALILVAMVVAGHLLIRSIVQPLQAAARATRRIGEGDLAAEVDTSRNDEIGDVMRSVADMRDSLRGIVGQVRLSADSIQVASSEVAQGNADMSRRTEQSASSLQQTASSVEEIAGTVRQTADSASTAEQLARSAAETAQRGGTAVSEVVNSMDEIQGSSRRIADIIGVIDGIAFQTNILALNAAVEAARAGEQGRGFAVVAGEVRSLAQRSAEAAREIKSLIGASVERVDAGSRQVKVAGSTMNELVSSVQRVSDMIAEINAATGEQSSGIALVNGAIAELDKATQQNAALVEQSAAASESLREQAQRLAGLVQHFRLGDGGHAAPAVAAAAPASAPVAPVAPARLAEQAIERARAKPASTTAPGHDDWETF